jgi:MFS family permease
LLAIDPPVAHTRASGPRQLLDRRGVAATVAGNALEFYDFLIYSTFTVYIGHAFFPADSALASLLLALATFGVGFLTRPLGGLLIGAYADRAGRRPALLLSITLMGIGTLAVVLTPSYASIGALASVALVVARLVQGLALGGEVGPSTVVLLEAAPTRSRGFFVSWQGASQGLAVLVAGLVGLVLTTLLNKAQMAAWGWRVAFAVGLLIVPVGLYMRRRLPETLEVRGARGSAAVLGFLWQQHRRPVLLSVLIIMCVTITTYVSNYMTTYALTALGMPASKAILATVANGAVMAAGALMGGRLTDRFGRRWVMMLPRIILAVAVYPALLLLLTVTTSAVLTLVTAVLTLLSVLSASAATAAVTEAFPSEVRSSGLAVSYAMAVAVFGGTTQFVIAWLIGTTGDRLSPAYYVIATSVIGLWAMFKLTETSLPTRPQQA